MRTYKKPSTILSKAADEVEEEGKWVQGAMLCAKGRKCAIGAMAYYSGDLHQFRGINPELYLDEVIEVGEVVNDPSQGFKEAVAFAARELNTRTYNAYWDEYTNDEAYYNNTPKFSDFANQYYESFMDVVIDNNDQGSINYNFGPDKRKVAAARKKVIKGLRKAAEKAKAAGR